MSPSTDSFEEIESAVVRFAGDSGDGMQTVGERFTDSSAFAGNDIATLPDFPAEIRAPAGTLAGVSGFQLQFGSRKILTPGDEPDALVAMNPAALKANIDDLPEGGMLVVNIDSFKKMNLAKAGYEISPLEDEEFRKKYHLVELDLTSLTKEALKDSPLKPSDKARCKNFFALGFMYYVYGRPLEPTLKFFSDKWGKKLPELSEANSTALKAGFNLGDTMETARNRYQVSKAPVQAGVYRKISGNEALVYGLVAGAKQANRELLYAGYPITPASPILEGLSALKKFGVKTLQAEDEIAAMGMAIGASFAGDLSVVATSGPGMCLKSEFIGLASITELPVVIVDVQRGGPSTGLPTKTEQSDLLQSLYARHGDCPLPVLAAHSPSDCFDCAMEASRIALTYMTPVILLSDLYVANGAEPWKIPNVSELPTIDTKFADPNEELVVYKRDSINCIEALTLYYFENEDQLNGSAWLTLLLEKQPNHRFSGTNGIKEKTLQSQKIKSAIQKIQTQISNVKNAPTFDPINKNRKVEEVILKDGSKYLGQITDGIPNGYGYKISSSGQSHLGYFENGLENGLGKSINQDGIITYEGFWKDGIPIK